MGRREKKGRVIWCQREWVGKKGGNGRELLFSPKISPNVSPFGTVSLIYLF